MISVESLIRAGVGPTQARQFAEPLKAACALFAIDTRGRVAAFLGQIRVESLSFTALEENLNYRSADRILQVFKRLRPIGLDGASRLVRNPQALANKAYAGINGNGDEASGDGWRYRGRGLKQLTGRANYQAAQAALSRPYVAQPELVAQPSDACLTAAWYWHSRNLNELADAWNIALITERVNGPARLQLDERRQYAEEALQALQAVAA
jgi:putative chitinase